MPLNDGYANSVAVAQEGTFLGSIGSYTKMRGRIRFDPEPVHGGGGRKVSVWRQPTKSTRDRKFWRGSLEAEYSHHEATHLLIANLFAVKAQQADTPSSGLTTYTLRPRRTHGDFTNISLALALDYDGGPYYVFTGCFVTDMRLSIERNRSVRVRYGLVAAKRTSGSETGGTDPGHTMRSHMDATVSVDAVAQTTLVEANWTVKREVQMAAYGDDGVPTSFEEKPFEFSGELPLYFDGSSLNIPDKIDSHSEAALGITLATGGSKKLQIDFPRGVFVGGSPGGIAEDAIVYRPVFEGLQDEDLNPSSEPLLTFID